MSFYCIGFDSESPYNNIDVHTYEHEYEDGWPFHGQHDTSGEASAAGISPCYRGRNGYLPYIGYKDRFLYGMQ